MPDSSLRQPSPGAGTSQSGWALVAGQLTLLALLALEAWRRDAPPPLRLLGGVAVLAGASVMGLASSRLGRQLRAHPAPAADAVLRTDGAYRHVRHPIYSGLLLLAAGLAAVAGTLRAAIEGAALLGLLTAKARLEERLLAERFPAYPEYARRTPRFVPRFRRPAVRPPAR